MKVAVATCVSALLVPVTVTVYIPAVPEHESVDVPEPVTLVGIRVQAIPVAGLMLDVKLTIPLKPLRPVTVIVEFPDTPALAVTVVGLAEIV